MYLVFTRMPRESYRRPLRSLLLCLCDVFEALINSSLKKKSFLFILIFNFYCEQLGSNARTEKAQVNSRIYGYILETYKQKRA